MRLMYSGCCPHCNWAWQLSPPDQLPPSWLPEMKSQIWKPQQSRKPQLEDLHVQGGLQDCCRVGRCCTQTNSVGQKAELSLQSKIRSSFSCSLTTPQCEKVSVGGKPGLKQGPPVFQKHPLPRSLLFPCRRSSLLLEQPQMSLGQKHLPCLSWRLIYKMITSPAIKQLLLKPMLPPLPLSVARCQLEERYLHFSMGRQKVL